MEDHPLSDKQVREKLIARGASALTDTELLSILLHGSGPGGPATELAGRLLDRFDIGRVAAQRQITAFRTVMREQRPRSVIGEQNHALAGKQYQTFIHPGRNVVKLSLTALQLVHLLSIMRRRTQMIMVYGLLSVTLLFHVQLRTS